MTLWIIIGVITSVYLVCRWRYTHGERSNEERASRMDWWEVLFLLVLISAFGSIVVYGTWAFVEMIDILLHFGGLG